MIDIASMLFGYTLTPLYDTLGKKTVNYVLNQTKSKCLALSGKHLKMITELKTNNELPNLETLILMESFNIDKQLIADATQAGF